MNKSKLNADGISVAGCNIIYAPKGQAGEYAPLATSPYRGCGHKCRYCYVPQVLHMPRTEFDAGAIERPNFLNKLKADARKYFENFITEQVMLSFTTDPYHPGNTTLTRQTIETLRDFGLAFCTLTKGGKRALRDIDLFRQTRDAFASTLTSVHDDGWSRRWEPDAASPLERLETLKTFHDAGIFTWVSLEPVLDPDSTLEVISETHSFIDLYKIGKANYIPLAKEIDWQEFTNRVIDLCQKVGAKHYIKKDLQPYLPAGYENPLRIPQHN